MSSNTQQAALSAPAIPSTASVVRFALDELRPSPANPRRVREDDPALRELAESLRTLGQIEPIVIRAIDAPDVHGEILAGERRWRAARLAGLADIECKVLHCDDRTALEITVVENLQRQDLHPLEEARGVRSLLDAGWPVDEIASHLGKSERWVVSRAAITNLSPAWLDGLAKGDAGRFAWAGVAHLELIARLPAETQEAMAAEILERHYADFTVDSLARHIDERWLRVLSAAPWKMDDDTLVPASGACAACTKRSGCQQVLFADLAKKDRCLDVVCWNGKVAAHTLRKAAEIRKAEERVVIIENFGSVAPKGLPKDVPMVSLHDVSECKKTEPGAVKAIRADSGRQVWVKAESYASPATVAALGGKAKRDPVIEVPGKDGYRKVQEYRRAAKRFAFRYAKIGAAADGAKRPADAVLWTLVAVLISDHGSVEQSTTWKMIASMDAEKAREVLWEAVRERLPGEHSRVLSCSMPDPAAVEAMERLVGLDPKEQLAAALAEHPEPKPKAAKVPTSAKVGSGKVAKPKPSPAKRLKQAKASIRKQKKGAA